MSEELTHHEAYRALTLFVRAQAEADNLPFVLPVLDVLLAGFDKIDEACK